MVDPILLFEENLRQKKRLSNTTCACYLSDVRLFADERAQRGQGDCLSATAQELEEYRTALLRRGHSVATVNRSMTALRSFYRVLTELGCCRSNPAKGIVNLHQTRSVTVPPEERTIRRLLSMPDDATPLGSRDKAMLWLLSATDLQVSELLTLQVHEVDQAQQQLHLPDRAEPVLLPRPAWRPLEHYLHWSRPALVLSEEEPMLFLNQNGTALSRQGFWKLLRAYSERAQLSCALTPQHLRTYSGFAKAEGGSA